MAARLSDRFYCIALDQRGYGQSYSPTDVAAYRIEHLVSDLVALIDHIGGPIDVAGHDWGAAAAVPHKGRIVIKSPGHFNINQPLEQLLIHEYSHLALAHRTGTRTAPRWSKKTSARGELIRSKNPDSSGTVTIIVNQTSRLHQQLTTLAAQDAADLDVVGAMVPKDLTR